ncbi:hypothetical protein EWM64_g4466 [Hericium alpestre]|uniref:Reverse transcriptase domain-containing protein n=1 Tax=Hericium alpestre TaxID=135208 RepID=A0A4Z0A1G1_9AGAM|nr:hypothetical protein EWM64_g4466 [Hericium alpestre]
MASPFFFIKKKDGKLCPVQDYRLLNKGTIPNKYPLPLIGELIDQIKDAKYFTKMDIYWGYNNIQIKEGDEWKAAFQTKYSLFEPTVMFFGLCNSPATFQAFMNEIFHNLIREGHVIVYMDNILIFTPDCKTHQLVTEKVLKILRENHLTLKPTKCTFEAPEVDYLGLIVGNGQVRMDPKKVKAITEWPVPTNKKGIQQFLGFCNFYHHFIHNFSHIARPLTHLTGNVDWKWTSIEACALYELKVALSTQPVLQLPCDHGHYHVECDLSDFATGTVLSQEIDQKWHPIAFMSKTLSAPERNYEIYDKELLVIMNVLDDWRQYLLGAKDTFEIWTDHANLLYFKKPQKLNRRQAQWFSELADYDFVLLHKSGKEMTKADTLSRRSGLEKGVNNNEDIILLKPELFCLHNFDIRDMDAQPSVILQRIAKLTTQKDKLDTVAQVGLLKKEHDWVWTPTIDNNRLLTYKGLIYVPRDHKLRMDIIDADHYLSAAGHPGIDKTLELVSRYYWWPGMRCYVTKACSTCIDCQRTKVRHKLDAPLCPNTIPTEPWQEILVDLIGPLSESEGYNAICVIVD